MTLSGRLRIVVRRALRRRRVKRDLEIGLDLGVIGREHTVAGIGGLAVDCLAAPLSLDRSTPPLVGQV